MLILIKMAEAGHGESQQLDRPPTFRTMLMNISWPGGVIYFHNLVGALL